MYELIQQLEKIIDTYGMDATSKAMDFLVATKGNVVSIVVEGRTYYLTNLQWQEVIQEQIKCQNDTTSGKIQAIKKLRTFLPQLDLRQAKLVVEERLFQE